MDSPTAGSEKGDRTPLGPILRGCATQVPVGGRGRESCLSATTIWEGFLEEVGLKLDLTNGHDQERGRGGIAGRKNGMSEAWKKGCISPFARLLTGTFKERLIHSRPWLGPVLDKDPWSQRVFSLVVGQTNKQTDAVQKEKTEAPLYWRSGKVKLNPEVRGEQDTCSRQRDPQRERGL